jgi:hypothetical protein
MKRYFLYNLRIGLLFSILVCFISVQFLFAQNFYPSIKEKSVKKSFSKINSSPEGDSLKNINTSLAQSMENGFMVTTKIFREWENNSWKNITRVNYSYDGRGNVREYCS